MLANEVRPGPNRYITGEGVLFDLPEYLNDFDQVAVITGDQSFDVLKPIIRIHLTILFIAMMAPQVMRMLRS